MMGGDASSCPPPLVCCPPSSSAVDCLVLGAGASGLAAAAALAKAGLEVLVMEARDRLGGRVHTLTVQDGQQQLDLGASWVHGTTGNPIAAVAARHAITLLPTDIVTTTLFSSCGRRVVSPVEAAQQERTYQAFCSWLQALRRDSSAAVAHSQLSVAEAARLFAAEGQLPPEAQHGLQFLINRWIEQEYGADASELSALLYDADEPCEGEDALFPGGFGQVIAALAAQLPPGCVLLKHEVTNIRYSSSSGVTVTAITPQGGTRQFSARFAVVTFPLGLLKQQVAGAGGCSSGSTGNGGYNPRPPRPGGMFHPPLPESKAAAIARLGVGLLNKVILIYDAAFWSSTPWINRMPGPPHQGRWMEFFNLAAFLPQSRPALVAFNAGAWDAEKESDEELTRQVTEVLAAMFPAAAAAARSPRQVIVTRWGSDPWSRGSYACMAVGSSMEDLDALAAPLDGVLFFAGEAMSKKNQGTVHGAYATGLAAAEGVLMAAKAAGR